MSPQPLLFSSPFPGRYANKGGVEVETAFWLCKGHHSSDFWKPWHDRSIFPPRQSSLTGRCSKLRSTVAGARSAVLSFARVVNSRSYLSELSSCGKEGWCFFAVNAGISLDVSVNTRQTVHSKGKQVLVHSFLGNNCTSSWTHAPGSSPHFALELPGNGWQKSAKELSRFRVHAQKDDSGRNWWQRLLFMPFDPEKYAFVEKDDGRGSEYDSEDEAKGDSDGAGKKKRKPRDAYTDEELVGDEIDRLFADDEINRLLADDARFAAWQQRVKAQKELWESQKLGRDPGNENWEDWLGDGWEDYSSYEGGKASGWYDDQTDWEKGGMPRPPPTVPERGMSRNMKEMFLRIFENEDEVLEDLAYEDRVFRFTSQTTVKFVAVLVVIPWLVSYVSHDFVIVPFLNRWVEKVPLAAELLDARRSQKLKMVDTLKMERQRVRFEAAIGKAPPLSDEELLEHIREEALELRDEVRLENRKAFGNIWSDLLAGVTFLLLLVFNPDRVAIMRLTGSRLFKNISDTGKAFIIILLSDIFLGYHSESGWETVVEMVLEHYGFEVEQASIYLFVAIVPVTIDACFKLWVFRFLTRLSPSAAATFKEMQRH